MITNRELLAELKKPGKIWMPVMGHHDVHHLLVSKADLIRHLKELPPDEEATWTFFGEDIHNEDRWLDLQD